MVIIMVIFHVVQSIFFTISKSEVKLGPLELVWSEMTPLLGWWDGLLLQLVGFTRPGKRANKKLMGKIHHAINGKTHEFYGHFQ